ncbi:receptor-like protein 9a [Juglans regia]|uniref:Receptor-like protein 9a n=1 Tax=Juglans regia TaxID=51240 RepID=A0A6P9EGK1_JUGRE|nr:receptor-like protein 9a [Juglans regia]
MEFGIFGWWLMLAALFQLSSIHACLREEREALLRLKASINSSYVYLFTSWNSSQEGRNCCDWESVVCDNTTGRVIELHLSYVRAPYQEVWYLNASLFLPFQELKYLDLSYNAISRWAPNEGFERLSGLSKLEVLDFSGNNFNESFLLSLGQVLSLKELYLRGIQRDRPINIPISELGRLKNLQELYLDGSYIDKSFLNKVGVMTYLNVLSIQYCGFNGSLPIVQGLCELMNLRELDLSHNDFEGILPSCLANMTQLRIFDISSNRFNGSIDLSPLPSLKPKLRFSPPSSHC